VTLFLGAELLLAASLTRSGTGQTDHIWKLVQPSVAEVRLNERVTAAAVYLGGDRLFLAYGPALPPSDVMTGAVQGSSLRLRRVAADSITQTVLLQAQDALPLSVKPVRLAVNSPAASSVVLNVGSEGPKLAEVARTNVAGIMQPTQRYMPFAEIRLSQDSNGSGPGGSFTFDASGRLSGMIGALVQPSVLPEPGFGPANLSVAYALSPTALGRIVEGFLSESREVMHPSIGVFFRQGPGKGAMVESVSEGSSAAAAGVRAGDVIVRIDRQAVASPVELAAALFDKKVGQSISLVVVREGRQQTLRVEVQGQVEGRA
jgi:S1-C subfamily serine protease